MSNYTEKETKIIKQCNVGPFHTLVTDISNKEFNDLVDKLISDNSDIFPTLVAIYPSYNRNKIIDYYIDKGNIDMLLGFLDYCYDFEVKDNILDQRYIVDKLIQKNDKQLISDILKSNDAYFLTNNIEKEKLINFISTN